MPTKKDKLDAQDKLCKKLDAPFFAPTTRCYRCGRDIWEVISLEKASTELITGCPYCCWSYCE